MTIVSLHVRVVHLMNPVMNLKFANVQVSYSRIGRMLKTASRIRCMIYAQSDTALSCKIKWYYSAAPSEESE